MKSKNKSRSRRLLLVNTFGTLGYLSLLLQWAWTAIILLYPLLQSGAIQRMLTPKQPAKPIEAHPEYYSDAAPFIAAISVIITIAVIVISVVTILGLPKKIGKTGAKITHSTADIIVAKTPPLKKHTAKKRNLNLSYKLIIGIKLALTILPAVLLLFAPQIARLPHQVIITVGNFCLTVSIIYWLIQYSLAKILHVSVKEIW